MANEKTDFSESINNLYRQTYPDTLYNFSFKEFSETEFNGEHFVIGVTRNKNTEYTDIGHYKPHARSESTTFLARVKDGKLTGDSIRIKAVSVEPHQYNPQKMSHLSNEKLLKIQKGYTFIEVDKNKSAELPRYKVYSDHSVTGRTEADLSSFTDGFYNVADRAALLEAIKCEPSHAKDAKAHKLIRDYCQAAIMPNAADAEERAAETVRIREKAAAAAKQERTERMSALRDFAEKHPANGSLISKFTRKFEAKKHIRRYQDSKRAQAEKDLDFKRNINILSNIIRGTYDR